MRPRTRVPALAAGVMVLLSPAPAGALSPAPETGACSLENAVPATVAAVDEAFELLLDDGRRAAIAGLEFPAPAAAGAVDRRAAAHGRLSGWLVGRDVFIRAFAAGPDRWGRVPAAVFAAQRDEAAAPIVSVAAALLEEGAARFRPDPPASPCAAAYRAAEATAREPGRGLWADRDARPVPAGEGAGPSLLQRKGMVILEGKINSVGESRGAIYLNFGEKRAETASIMVLRRNLAMLQASGIDPAGLVGRRVRVRGLIETGFGPRIEVSTPAEIEVIEGPAP
ncbi:MAG: thermonuclease family protein [Methylocystis sp.]|uniref:thermonuclease family protein n=1 Tax=Methylocystis sp. TaxID=1911079 RepID=UPI003DA44A30